MGTGQDGKHTYPPHPGTRAEAEQCSNPRPLQGRSELGSTISAYASISPASVLANVFRTIIQKLIKVNRTCLLRPCPAFTRVSSLLTSPHVLFAGHPGLQGRPSSPRHDYNRRGHASCQALHVHGSCPVCCFRAGLGRNEHHLQGCDARPAGGAHCLRPPALWREISKAPAADLFL